MLECKVIDHGNVSMSNVRHISIDYEGYSFTVIFGRYINGGFFSIPNWNVGGELARFDDVLWNTESITRAFKKKKIAKQIALAIAEYGRNDGTVYE